MGSQLNLSKVARLWLKSRSAHQQELEPAQLTNPMLANRAAYVIDVGRLVPVYDQLLSDSNPQGTAVGSSADRHSGDASAHARVAQIEQQLREAQRELGWMREKVALKDQVIAGLEAQIKLLSAARDNEPGCSDVDNAGADATGAGTSGMGTSNTDASGQAEPRLSMRRPALFSQLDAAGWAERDGLLTENAGTATALSGLAGDEPEGAADFVIDDESSDMRLDDVHPVESDANDMQLILESQDEPSAAYSDTLGSEPTEPASDQVALHELAWDEPASDELVLDEPFVHEPNADESGEAVGSDPSKLLFELPQDLLDLPSAEPEAAETGSESINLAAAPTGSNEAETRELVSGRSEAAEPDAASVPAGSAEIEEQDWSLPDFSSSESGWPAASEPAPEERTAVEPLVESLDASSVDAPSPDPTPAGSGASGANAVSRSEWDALESELDSLKQMMDAKANMAQGSDPARLTVERPGQTDPFEFDLDIPELTLDMRILPGSSALAAPVDIDESGRAEAEAVAPVDAPAPDKEVQDYLAESRQRRWALWRNKTK